MEALTDLLFSGDLEEHLDGLGEVRPGFLDGRPLARDVDVGAVGNVAVSLTLDDGGELMMRGHEGLPPEDNGLTQRGVEHAKRKQIYLSDAQRRDLSRSGRQERTSVAELVRRAVDATYRTERLSPAAVEEPRGGDMGQVLWLMRMVDTHSGEGGVRRTVVLDDALLRAAQRALGTPTIRATIERSLRETIRQRGLRAFAEALGTFEMATTREELLAQRRREAGAHVVGAGAARKTTRRGG